MLEIIHKNIFGIKGFVVKVAAKNPKIGEMAYIKCNDGTKRMASVICVEQGFAYLQLFNTSHGLATDNEVVFLNSMFSMNFSEEMFGKVFNGLGDSVDHFEMENKEKIPVHLASYNPESRMVPYHMIRTGIPMIDIFNCLVRSQKIPVFCSSGDKYNELLIRIAENTDADAVIIGGIALTYRTYSKYLDFMDSGDRKVIAFMNRAEESVAEAINIPDISLACASKLAEEGKNVLVLLSDMTAYADALKEIAITMDQLPSNRGYPGTLYSDLAVRYEQAVDIEGSGSVTIISSTTMPGGDITHPVPDNTGYITEGQIYISGDKIDPFQSLSRLKQLVIGKETRKDHAEIANAMIRMYSESVKIIDKQMMGFDLNERDVRSIEFAREFESRIMSLSVVLNLEDALNACWEIISKFFKKEEVGIKEDILREFWQGE